MDGTNPTFVVLGTGKTGTTWLFRELQRHPDVFIVPSKETNFFDINYQRGMQWYRGFFEDGRRYNVRGEISHRYLNSADIVATRMRRSIAGDLRLVATFREVVSYVTSDYRFCCRNGRFAGSLDDFLEREFDWTSIEYANMLRPFLATFGKNSVLVTNYSDFRIDRVGWLNGIESFLGVQPSSPSDVAEEVVNGAAIARSPVVARAVNRLAKFGKRHGGQRLIQAAKDRTWLLKALYVRDLMDAPVPSADYARELRKIGRRVAGELDELTGMDFSGSWYGEDVSAST